MRNSAFRDALGPATIGGVSTALDRDSVDTVALIDALVDGVLATVDAEMRGQPASMVYEILDATLQRRLPGIPIDDERLRDAAARISVGVPIPSGVVVRWS